MYEDKYFTDHVAHLEWRPKYKELEKIAPDIVIEIMRYFSSYYMLFNDYVTYEKFRMQTIFNKVELKYCQQLYNQLENIELGNIVDSTSENINNVESENTNSYLGYNVEGDFNKVKQNINNNNNATSKVKNINLLDETFKISQLKFNEIFNKLIDSYRHIFQSIYRV